MKTNIVLIQNVIDSDTLRQYAVWLRLKALHINSRIYNYSLKKLSAQSNISRNGLRNHIEFFTANKWLRIEGNDIIFIAHDKLKKLFNIKLKANIKIKSDTKVTDIVNSLRYETLKHKQKQFDYAKQLNNDRNKPTGKDALKRYKKACKKVCANSREVTNYLKISVKKLSLLIKKSSSTASKLIKLKNAFVIRGKKTFTRCKKNLNLPFGFYWNKGVIIKVECNQYNFF